MTDDPPCNFCKRIVRNVGVIKQFRDIADTGILPPGFRWTRIQWQEGQGWKGWVWGPGGCNDFIRCRRIPDSILAEFGPGYLDLRKKYDEEEEP